MGRVLQTIEASLAPLAASLLPGGRLVAWEPLRPDATGGDAEKALGYGNPIRITVQDEAGNVRRFVFRTEAENEFGHERRADRMAEALVSWDLFNELPDHVRAVDVGALDDTGRPVSLRGAGEPYLVTEWIDGVCYAEDLRRVARDGALGPLDVPRAETLARWLVQLHAERHDDPGRWRRAIRDLVGAGEGIFGIVDGYPADTPAASPERLQAIEERCLAWRWRLRGRPRRLARTHGDFHPFNILFRPGGDGLRLALLDASRGGQGDPADDVTALAVNFVLFAAEHRAAWKPALAVLWRRFWEVYLAGTGDPGVLDAAPPFLAWRALVVSCPRFYPGLGAPARDLMLTLAERVLDNGRLDLDLPERLLAQAG
jgi:hypothetical protein